MFIKGNPFLKSGEGKEIAQQFLFTKNTDISLLSRQAQKTLEELVDSLQRIELYQNLYNRILLHIEFRKEYEPRVVTEEDLNTILEEEKIYADVNRSNRNGTV